MNVKIVLVSVVPAVLALLLTACYDPPSSTVPDPGGDPAARPSIVHFTATPANQAAPGPVTLAWEVAGASSLDIDQGVGSVTPTGAGSKVVILGATTTFTLTAKNAAGSATARVTASLNAVPFSYRVDSAVQPFEATVMGEGGPRPVAAVRDSAGRTSSFVANELIVLPGSQAELDALLARTGATVLDSYSEGAERTVLLRVDPATLSLERFSADANTLGSPGESVFSSEQGARLLAQVAREQVGGLKVSANFLDQPQALLTKTQEGGMLLNTPEKSTDAFTRPEYNNTVSKPGVVQAWQFVAAHGLSAPSRRVRVAIIDGGFWLNPADGSSPRDVNGQGDFPPVPIQEDFVGPGNASGTNPNDCGGSNSCPWHGNGSASVAVGTLNNGAFAAGTGGQVADPMLLRSDLEMYSVKHAIDWARNQGADVINMSFGGECGWWCRRGKDAAGYYDAIDRAHDAGIFMVASAGNGGGDQLGDEVNGSDIEPCIIGGVFCVGALGGASQVYTNTAKSYSNYGADVRLWAPTDIVAMPDGGSGGNFVIHNGTSASAPYVAGVAAMMKAMNPALNGDQISTILQDTAWTDSPDPLVARYLNAFAAVKRAADNQLPTDRFEPNNDASRATLLSPGQYDDLNLHSAQDTWDYFRFNTGGPSLATIKQTSPSGFFKFGLGGLSKDKGCGEATFVSTSADKKEDVYRLPSGSFHFVAVGTGPIPYDLNLKVQTAPVLRDTYEGVGGNDTPATKTNLGDRGGVSATLHTASDVDYYEFYSAGQTSSKYFDLVTKVRVLGSDVPLTLRAYDYKGTLLGTATTSADCSKLAELIVPSGFITVQVSGGAPGAYSAAFGSYIASVLRYQEVRVLVMHPDGPVEIGLRDPEQAFVLDKVSDFPLVSLTLRGAGLHMTLYSAQGQHLAEGQASDFSGVAGETLTPSTPVADQQTVLKIERVNDAPVNLGGDLAVIPATLELLDR